MKNFHYRILPILLSLLFLTSCSKEFYTESELASSVSEARDEAYSRAYEDAYEEIYPEAFSEGYAEGEAAGYDTGYSHGREAGWEDSNVDAIEEYYEALCDKYGYMTYDMLYHPHLWNNYVVEDSFVYHTDWCCPDFHHSSTYFCASEDSISASYSQCLSCENSKTYYCLDETSGVFHAASYHLNLTTNDYISPTTVYHLVSYDAAIAQGYTPCPECAVQPN